MGDGPAVAEHVLDGLDDEQRAAVLADRGPVCVLAGAGTGKTRAITSRIAYGVLTGAVPAQHLLAVTFTARAAGEMRGRLRQLGVPAVQARTFHAAALRQLTYFWPRIVGGAMPTLLESKVRLVASAAGRCRLTVDRTALRDLTSEIEWSKAVLAGPEGYPAAAAAAGREPPRAADEVARVYAAYEELKRSQEVVDFDDLLLVMSAALEEHEDVASELYSRYRCFVVDEYQDVNPLQQRLLDAWLGDRDDLCVVGDPAQTIYSFTGASPNHLLQFSRRYPAATVVRLVRDYRSTPQVVTLANRLLAGGPPASSQSARIPALELQAQRPPGPEPTFTEHDDEVAEAAGVARRCAELVAAGTPASEVAVLFRVNAQSSTFEQAMSEAGVPYVVRGAERFFERPEVREAVMFLRGAARAPEAGVGAGLAQAAQEVLVATGWTPDTPPSGGAARERWESVAALLRVAEQVEAADPGAGLRELVGELDERAAAQHAPTVDGVTLASLHAAKGLEWDAVFLVGLVDGTLPITHATTPAQVEEERRLLYVGVTRARSVLALSWALARAPGGRRSRRPSRFLDGLRPGHAAGRHGPAGTPGASRRSRREPMTCRGCGRALATAAERSRRRCVSCPVTVDGELFDRLRSWRSERAKGLGQPAFCVLTDATLSAIAEVRPTTASDLVAIPGIGKRKLDAFGSEVLAIVGAEAAPPE